MRKPNIFLSALIVLVTSVSPNCFAQSAAAPVKVTARGVHYSGQVVYSYQVQNLGQSAIRRFMVGHYNDEKNGRAELTVAPRAMPGGASFWLPSPIVTSPNGWGAKIVYPEESPTFFIEWIEAKYFKQIWPQAPQTSGAPYALQSDNGIPQNAAWDQFKVTLPKEDYAYVDGHVTVEYGGDLINVPITKEDTTPPTIDLNVTRLNQNDERGTWAIFKVEVAVSDNVDPAPQLVFASTPGDDDVVVSKDAKAWNFKLKNVPGKSYQFKFVATDASGNTSTRTFDYSVSHKRP